MATGPSAENAKRDALIVAGFTAVVFAIALYVDLAERAFDWTLHYRHLRMDELLPTVYGLVLALLWYAYRRWRELRSALAERDRLVGELRDALEQIKVLRGLLPICAWCRKVRDDEGYWHQLETYIEERSDAQFTHGVCPDCEARLMEGLPRS